MFKNIRLICIFLSITFILTSCQNQGLNWLNDSTIYEVNLRQYTEEGTIKAFEEHLPRLKELGVEILWFMPIHPISEEKRKGTLGSYYAVKDYKAVNPEYGTMDDFKDLVDKCHDMGFKVILDWVPNHTGWDNQWIKDHPDWYTQQNGQIIHPAGTNWTDVADLNYDNTDMRKAMIDALKFWVKEIDIDGYRCDVAGSVPVDFWEEAYKELRKIKPVFMLAEDGSNFELLENAFKSNYGWSLMGEINNVAKGKKNPASAIKRELKRIEAIYPEGTFPMNFITNHDENSWNGTAYERLGSSIEVMNVLIFTSPGIPLIYSGQEASLNKRLAFFDKDEIDWSDLSMQNFYSSLVKLKKDNKALWNGNAGGDLSFINTDNKNVLCYTRERAGNKVIVVLNLSKDTISATCDFSDYKGTYTEYFTQKSYTLQDKENFELKPWGYYVLVN